MNKYEELLNAIRTNYGTHSEYYKTVKELVDQTKTPTLEEIKKEWEDDGWRINDSSGFICFAKLNPRTNMNDVINYHPLRKILSLSFYGDENIDIKVLQRITKTTRALRSFGWEV